jgi:flagellin FlaB
MHKAVKLNLKEDDVAAIGIGTLIVFIALVLVAAIAAAVIIKTAYSLKDQAESTGEGARQEVAGSIKILSVVGDRGAGPAATIDDLWIYCTVWDGSRGIDVSKMRIVVRTASDLDELSLDTTAPYAPSSTEYEADEVPTATPGNGWNPPTQFFLDADNVIRINIDLDALGPGGTGGGVNPNTAVTVQFMPGSGPVVSEYFVSPPSYGGDRYIDLTAA